MKVLLTGAAGQVGQALQRLAPPGVTLSALSREALDITRPDDVELAVARDQPDWIINAAAYTAVDRAETEPERAYAINEAGAANLAQVAAARSCRLLQISTDFVFSGHHERPLRPGDETAPVSVYGTSKLAGERAVLQVLDDAVVIRSAWIYSAMAGNFVSTMLKLMRERDELRVVCDQVGSPTRADNLAQGIWQALQSGVAGGVYHCADAGETSWHGLANAVYEEASACGLLVRPVTVQAVSAAEYGAAAARPAYSVLDNAAATRAFGYLAQPWRDALRATLQGIGA